MAGRRMLGCRGLRRSFGDVVAVDGWGSEGDGGEVVVAGEPVASMPCHGGDGPAAGGQECTPGPAGLADGATLDELQEQIVFLRSLGAPGGAHLVIGLSDDDARAGHRRRTGLGRGTACRR